MDDILEQFIQSKREANEIERIIDDLSFSSEGSDNLDDSMESQTNGGDTYVSEYAFKNQLNYYDQRNDNSHQTIDVTEDQDDYKQQELQKSVSNNINKKTPTYSSSFQNGLTNKRSVTSLDSHNSNNMQTLSSIYNNYNQQSNNSSNGFDNFGFNRQNSANNMKPLNPTGFDAIKLKKANNGVNQPEQNQQSITSFLSNQSNSNNGTLADKRKKANASNDINSFIIGDKKSKTENSKMNELFERYNIVESNTNTQDFNSDSFSVAQNQNQKGKLAIKNLTNGTTTQKTGLSGLSTSLNGLKSNFTPPTIVNKNNWISSLSNSSNNNNNNNNQAPTTTSKLPSKYQDNVDYSSMQNVEPQERPFVPIESKNKGKHASKINPYYTVADINEYALKPHPWDSKVNDILKNVYGYKNFRNNQRAIINCVLENKDVFAMMPTGGGKSLTFQIPGLVQDGIYLVVMPLISLISDQFSHMQRLNIPVIRVQGGKKNYQRELESILYSQQNTSKIVLITPEKISADEDFNYFLNQIYEKNKLRRFVIDEAHCVSSWGHEFRKDYLSLGSLKARFPDIPTLALTATATEKCKTDIIQLLNMKGTMYFQSSFNRTNLYYDVIKIPEKVIIEHMVDFIKQKFNKQSGIIYCCTRKDSEELAQKLNIQYKINAAYYHGQMNEKEKETVQQLWMADDIQVICATIAFGMGIDKSDVRFVIHYTFSKSIENYYQEAGRAGRDGKISHCRIYYSPKDKNSHIFLITNNEGSNKQKKEEGMSMLNKMIRYCEDTINCRRVLTLAHLGEKFEPKFCNKMCDNCRNQNSKNNLVQKDFTQECIAFLNGYHDMYNHKNIELTQKQLVEVLRGRKIQKKAGAHLLKIIEMSAINGFLKNYDQTTVENIIKELMSQGYLTERIKKFRTYTQVFLEVKKQKLNELANPNKQTDKILVTQIISQSTSKTKEGDNPYLYGRELEEDITNTELPKESEFFDQNKNLIFDGEDSLSNISADGLMNLLDIANKNKISGNNNSSSDNEMNQAEASDGDLDYQFQLLSHYENLKETSTNIPINEDMDDDAYIQMQMQMENENNPAASNTFSRMNVLSNGLNNNHKESVREDEQVNENKVNKFAYDDDEDDEDNEEEADFLQHLLKRQTEAQNSQPQNTKENQVYKSPEEQDNFFSEFKLTNNNTNIKPKSSIGSTSVLKTPSNNNNDLMQFSNYKFSTGNNKPKSQDSSYNFQKLAKS